MTRKLVNVSDTEGRTETGLPRLHRLNVRSHLNKYLPQGDEGRAELCQKQAANEEIPLVLSEELRNRQTEHTQSEQTNSSTEKTTQLAFKDSLHGHALREPSVDT